mgnify:CR=1 FL=1
MNRTRIKICGLTREQDIDAAVAAGLMPLAAIGIAASTIGAFYYLKIVKIMYFDEPKDHNAINAPVEMKLMLSVNAFGLLLLGLFPQRLMDICAYAVSHSLQ